MKHCISFFLCCTFIPLQVIHSSESADVMKTLPAYRLLYNDHTIASFQSIRNPAIFGMERFFQQTLLVSPLINLHAGYWNDKLALIPSTELFNASDETSFAQVITRLLRTSISLPNASPEKISKKIADHFRNGLYLYSGIHQKHLQFGYYPYNSEISTTLDCDVQIPAAPFQIVFSDGLKKGSTLDVSSLRIQALLATEIYASMGMENDELSYTCDFINEYTNDLMNLTNATIGTAVRLVCGHSMIIGTMDYGSLTMANNGNSCSINAQLNLKTAGTNITSFNNFNPIASSGFPISGIGIGLDAGLLLFGPESYISLGLQRLGAIRWWNVKSQHYFIKGSGLTIDTIIKTANTVDFFSKKNTLVSSNFEDSLSSSDAVYTSLATTAYFSVGHSFDVVKNLPSDYKNLSGYLDCSCQLEEGLSLRPSLSFIPKLSIKAENGFLKGYVPLQFGVGIGGKEKIWSWYAVGVRTTHTSTWLGIRSIGTPYFYPLRGCEVQASLTLLFSKKTSSSPQKLYNTNEQFFIGKGCAQRNVSFIDKTL